jgi:hypothetical protein
VHRQVAQRSRRLLLHFDLHVHVVRTFRS